jgi:hypothetical protein
LINRRWRNLSICIGEIIGIIILGQMVPDLKVHQIQIRMARRTRRNKRRKKKISPKIKLTKLTTLIFNKEISTKTI